MLPLLLTLSLNAAAATPEAAPLAPAVIVWTEGLLPPAEVQQKMARLTAGGAQLDWGDVAYAPGDRTPDDRTRVDAVQTANDAGRKRWDEFDVELGIAQALRTTVDAVTLVKDDADRNVLEQALVLESTAVMRAFQDTRFATIEDAGPFRVVVGDMVASKPLTDLLALDPDRAWTRDELGDGQILVRIEQYRTAAKALAPGIIHFTAAPPGVSLVVDGRALAPGVSDLPVLPGHHYAHAQAGTRIAGRADFDIASGETVDIQALLTESDLTAAKALVLSGKLDGLPDGMTKALTAIAPVNGKVPRVYLAAVDEKGHGHIVPWTPGAVIIRPKPVTFMLTGDVGGGFLNSSAFAKQAGAVQTTPQFGPQLGGQLGIYNFLVNVGGTMLLTPVKRFAYGGEPEAPALSPAGVRAWGGIGVYLPRPTRGVPLFSLGVNYGMFFPGSTGFGGNLTFGVPITDGKTWLRLSLDGFRTVQSPGWPQEGSANYAGAFRIGFGRLL